MKQRHQSKKKKEQARKKRAAKKRKQSRPEAPPPEKIVSVTERLVEQLEQSRELANPHDLLGRLAGILIDVAVLESAKKGLLGDMQELVIGGDGSMLRTGANRHGKRVCEHSHHQRCDCDKLYSDPDAQWGWDNHREQWFFGHHFYEISCSSQGHDLPMAISIAPGNESDYTASLKTLDHLIKSMNARLGPWGPAVYTADAGHDAEAIHRYLHQRGIKAVIPLKANARATHPTRPEISHTGAAREKGESTSSARCEPTSWSAVRWLPKTSPTGTAGHINDSGQPSPSRSRITPGSSHTLHATARDTPSSTS